MPRTLQEILDDQERIAAAIADYDPQPEDERDPAVWRALLEAASARVSSEVDLAAAVVAARSAGFSWALIGSAVGTTGQAAQQRYGRLTRT